MSEQQATEYGDFLSKITDELKAIDFDAMRRIGIYRDTGRYTLLAHFLPPEVTVEHLADDKVRKRLAEPTGPVSLYVHTPACTGRCTFCHYAIEVHPEEDRLHEYQQTLLKEITVRWGRDRTGPVRSVLVGGGTPTYFETKDLEKLFQTIHARVDVPPEVEFTCESSPETLTLDKLLMMRANGVNRLNIGVQSLIDKELRFLARRHDAAGAEAAVELARKAGFDNINIDLIFAMPHQDFDSWMVTLDRAIAMRTASITIYHLRKKRSTNISRHPSPSEDLAILQKLAGIRRLQAAGYRQSPTDYFCLPDRETGQVQARDKWRDMQHVDAVGMDGSSRRGDLIAYNHGGWDAYVESAIAQKGWSLAHGHFLTREQQLIQRVMFAPKSLDPQDGIIRQAIQDEFGVSVDEQFGDSIRDLVDVGLMRDEGDRILMTDIGTLFADEICMYFYPTDLRRRVLARRGVHMPQPKEASKLGVARLDTYNTEVIVIGGGPVGSAIAERLHRDHGMHVLVLDLAHDLASAQHLKEAGVHVNAGVRVHALVIDKGLVVGARTDGGVVFGRTSVLAAGTGSEYLLRYGGVRLPFARGERRTLVFEPPEATEVAVTEVVWYHDPDDVEIASATQWKPSDAPGAPAPPVWFAEFASRARRSQPGLAAASLVVAQGEPLLRGEGGLPYVGPCPGLDGLVLATGLGADESRIQEAAALGVAWVQQGPESEQSEAWDPRRMTLVDPPRAGIASEALLRHPQPHTTAFASNSASSRAAG